MKLQRFIKKYTEPNSLIRLWKRTTGGHEIVVPFIGMNWTVTKPNTTFYSYRNSKVVGIASILINDNYPETINIVIEHEITN